MGGILTDIAYRQVLHINGKTSRQVPAREEIDSEKITHPEK
jgi:hypothetical protein